MSCIRLTRTNQEESRLFNKLLEIVKDENTAEEMYIYFHTQDFFDIFGNYIENFHSVNQDSTILDRVDENQEPSLYLNKKLNKYYFLDKNNEPVYYPYTRQGLGQVLQTNDIKLFAKTLALQFYKKNVEFDYNNLSFNATTNQTLSSFIKEFLDSKVEELSNSDNVDHLVKGIALNETKNNLNEWKEEVKNYFNSLKVDYNIKEKESIKEQEESINDSLMRQESFLKSSKDNVNNNIKLFLSLIESKEINDFNENSFIEFDDIYATLNKAFSNEVAVHDNQGQLEDLFEIFLSKILKLSNQKPYFKDLHEYLSSSKISERFKNQFVSAFRLNKNNYLGSEINNNEGVITYDVKNLSEVGTRKSNLTNQWFFNFKQNRFSENSIKSIIAKSNIFSKDLIKNFKNIKEIKDLNIHKSNLKDLLKEIGVSTSERGLNFYINGLEYSETSLENKKQVLINTFSNINRALESYSDTNSLNNIFNTQNIFKKIAEAESFFVKEGSDASVFTIGKTKWVYSTPSYLDNKIEMWKKDPQLLKKHYNSTPYSKGSHYMEYLLGLDVNEESRNEVSKERLSKIELGVFNSIQQQGNSNNASDNKSLSYTDSLVDYVNKLLAFRKGGKVYHKTALAADKSTEYQIFYGNDSNYFNILSNADFDSNINEIKVNDYVLDIFYKYFKSEYERMSYEYDFILNNSEEKLLPNYHTGNRNALKSQLFPSLSISFENNEVVLPSNNLNLYDNNGKPLFTNLDEIKDSIKKEIATSLNRGIKETYDSLFENGLIEFNKEGKKENKAIDSNIYNKYITDSSINKAPLQIAADVFINSVISQVEYSKMFTGDVAYYKNIVDYKKRVPATYTDGKYMRLKTGEETFNASIIESVEVPVPSLNELEKILPKEIYSKYKEVNSTDAQAWVTPQRWKFLMERLGKWNNQSATIYDKFFQSNPIFTNKELKLLAQPVKGVYFDVIDGRPAFLKYSQAVLLPNLIKGTGLEILYNKMTKDSTGKDLPYKDQIHELITKDGIKVGYPTPSKVHDANGDVLLNSELNKLKLNNFGWKLQQDLPIKGVKQTEVGSQIQKNIFQGLIYNLEKEFLLGDKKLTGNELIDHINDLVNTLSNTGKLSLINKLGIDSDNKISNENILYSSLISQLKKRNDVPSNFLKALESNISPYGIPGGFQMFQNTFSSLVNKELVKIKTNGGSFIQMADFGLSKDEATDQGVIFTPWFEENKLSTPKLIKDENGNDVIAPGGIFLTGSLISKYIPDYKKYTSEELFGENGKIDKEILTNIIGYRIPNQGLPSNDSLQVMGILPEEMGDTVIAYTGITTKTGSDFDIDKMYLMIPSFDVNYTKSEEDKVLQYIKDNDITNEEIKEELTAIGYSNVENMSIPLLKGIFIQDVILNGTSEESAFYDDFRANYPLKSADKLEYSRPLKDSEGVEFPLHEQPKSVIQNKLIESYKSVLTNPEVISDIMNPIDVDYIKDDIKNLLKEDSNNNLSDFSAISDLKLKNDFMLGKAGLGQNVNSLVDSVRGGMANLFFNDHYIGWGLSNENDNTHFDNEYSEELSKTDILDYVKSFNENISKEELKITKEDVEKLSKVKLGESMMALVNGFVDIAKDPYIVQSNWVTQTNNIGFMLLRAGVHPFYVNSFLAQPILKEYVAFKNNKESKTVNDTSNIEDKFKLKKASDLVDTEVVSINENSFSKRNIFKSIVTPDKLQKLGSIAQDDYQKKKVSFINDISKDLIKKFKITNQELKFDPELQDKIDELNRELLKSYSEIFESELTDFNTLNLKDLRDQIKVSSNTSIQLTILDKFLKWQETAKLLTKSVNASKIDVNGKGKNITSLITSNNLIENLLEQSEDEGGLNGFQSKLIRNNKSTILNTYKENSIDFIYDVMRANPKYFLGASNSVVSTFNTISDYIYGKSLESTALADKLEKSHYSYIMSGFPPFVLSKEEKLKLLDELPKQLSELKENPNTDNVLLDELLIKNSSEEGKFFISMPNLRKSVSFKNTLTDSWKDLLETNPEFAENLIKYSYLITGFNNNINQFHEYIPYEWFNKNRFNSYLKTLSLNENSIDSNFIDQFFRHNFDDGSIIKKVFPKQVTTLEATDGFRTGFINKNAGKSPYLTKLEIQTDFETITRYYKLQGYNKADKAVYVRTSLLGFKDKKGNRFFEYNVNNNTTKPVTSINENNLINSNQINVELLNEIKENEDIINYHEDSFVVKNNLLGEETIIENDGDLLEDNPSKC